MTGFVRDWRSRTKESIHLKFELMGANDFRETIFPCLKPKVISEKEFPVFGNMLDWGRKENNLRIIYANIVGFAPVSLKSES